jgi:hypothetical protein
LGAVRFGKSRIREYRGWGLVVAARGIGGALRCVEILCVVAPVLSGFTGFHFFARPRGQGVEGPLCLGR